VFDIRKIIPDENRSLRDGAIEPIGKYKNNKLFALLTMLGRRYDFTLDDPVSSISEEGMNANPSRSTCRSSRPSRGVA